MAVDQTWWPSTAQVAALVNSRTATSGISEEVAVPGDTTGETFADDFSDTSKPSKARVEKLVELAALEFRSRAGHRDPCSDGLQRSAAAQVAFLAARLIEISYRTDTADSKDKYGAVQALRDLWTDGADALAQTIATHCPPDPDGPAISPPGAPPAPRGRGRTCPPILGLRTRW